MHGQQNIKYKGHSSDMLKKLKNTSVNTCVSFVRWQELPYTTTGSFECPGGGLDGWRYQSCGPKTRFEEHQGIWIERQRDCQARV